uniref:SCP domain-containing protein n=1 Tax=Caenorhabditis tropicalis TaxID=1561998 RepID=A0A1I7V3Q3_9PELO
MKRFSTGGQLLSVTDVKTTHFDDNPQQATFPVGEYYSNNRNTFREPEYDTVHTYHKEPRQEEMNYRIPRAKEPVERMYPIKKIDRVIPTQIIREYSRNEDSTLNPEWKTTDSYVRKASILKTSNKNLQYQPPPYPAGTFNTTQRVEWREPLDCLIDRMNKLRHLALCPPFEPSVRLADIAAQWARMLAIRGEFRSDHTRNMNIWMGSRVNDSIADVWWDESEEFGTRNHLDDRSLSWVGVASAFCEQQRQFIVVAVYE